jgi:hypothetical protein
VRPEDRARLDRLTDEAVAAEVAAGRFPSCEDVREIELRSEAAVHLAELAAWDPETVYVIGCARQIDCDGGPGDFVVRPREERTIARPDERVALVVGGGVRREEALVRLDHIRAHIAGLRYGCTLAPVTAPLQREPDPVARLEIARTALLRDVDQARGLPP